ncbi:Hypothetical predicted protein [Lecanosticta acicola]|uniref:Uncharacterized protein n=1 Tax=Lecanosticta acicola TaxID=111012 RepID=A0AAI9EBT8_9PEZI|nr:Hypothetical predicted protein [Lecanosticta acicola]
MSSQADGAAPSNQTPPYAPKYQGLGETPSILPDVPVNAVFLALFASAAVAHMTLFQINMHKRGKKFVFNAAIFGFCVTRIVATTLRIAWAHHPHNIALGMAAQIFVYAGVIVLFIANLFFAQRIVRAQHPRFGWTKPFSILVPLLLGIIVGTIFALIAAVIAQFYVNTTYAQQWTRDVQIYGATFYGFAAFLPIPIILISTIVKYAPAHRDCPVDNFGSGAMKWKILLVLFTSTLLSFGAWWRAGTELLPPTHIQDPKPWYFSKAAFYAVDFGIEIFVTLFYFFIRIDILFIIPNGAHGPFSYGNGFVFAGESGEEKGYGRGRGDSTRNLTGAPSFRASTITLPPPRSSRAGSWGSLEGYMTPSTIKSTQRGHVSWGGGTMSSEYNNSAVDLGMEMSTLPLEVWDFHFHQENAGLDLQHPPLVAGAEHELGYNMHTGKWEQRSIMRNSSDRNFELQFNPAGKSTKSRRASSAKSTKSRSRWTSTTMADADAMPDLHTIKNFSRPVTRDYMEERPSRPVTRDYMEERHSGPVTRDFMEERSSRPVTRDFVEARRSRDEAAEVQASGVSSLHEEEREQAESEGAGGVPSLYTREAIE